MSVWNKASVISYFRDFVLPDGQLYRSSVLCRPHLLNAQLSTDLKNALAELNPITETSYQTAHQNGTSKRTLQHSFHICPLRHLNFRTILQPPPRVICQGTFMPSGESIIAWSRENEGTKELGSSQAIKQSPWVWSATRGRRCCPFRNPLEPAQLPGNFSVAVTRQSRLL
jgi:hypothetical protein